MPSVKIVKTRTAGWCANDFAHPSRIEPGDHVMVTTYLPRDEAVSDFGVKPFTRVRFCGWCVAAAEQEAARVLARQEPHDARSEKES